EEAMSGEWHPGASLHDLHDGRLSPAEEAQVREHLRSCVRCQRELEALEALSGASRQLPRSEVPEGLRAALRRTLDAEDLRQVRMRRLRRVAAPLLLAAAAGLAWAFWPRAGERWPALAIHSAGRLQQGELALDVVEHRPDRLEAALRARGASARVLDLTMMGIELLGGSVREVGGRRVALIAYRDAQGRTLICEMLPAAGLELPPASEERHQGTLVFRVYGRRGSTAVFWQEGQLLCAL